MKLRPALAAVAFVTHVGPVLADSSPIPVNPIVVTATRTAETADQTLASVTVITREDIERRQPQDIVDLLRTQAGIDITRSGGPGGDIALFMRGTNSNHTLVLIDGVRVASLNTGAFDWRSLPIAQIERVEIVRGPRATEYGSDAIGGVIQIFTRRPRGLDVALGAGSYRTRRADIAAGSDGAVHVFATGSDFATVGFSSQNARGSSFDPDKDGERQQAVSAGVEADLRGNTRFRVIGRQSRGTAEFDIGESDMNNESLNARVSHTTGSAWTQTLSLGLFSDVLVTRSAFPSDIRTRRHTLDWQNEIALDQNSVVTAGLAYAQESGTNVDQSANTTLFDREQHSQAVFALWQRRLRPGNMQLAGRYDNYSSFGGHGTWSAAYGWVPWTGAHVWASYGTAFRAPSLNDLYHPGFFGGFFAGNPDLQPERSGTAELGLRQRLRSGQINVALFATRIDDLIAFEGPMSQAINIAKADVRGAEVEHSYRGEHWYLSTAVTFQRARNETTDSPLLRRPDRKLSFFAERHWQGAAVGAELVASSDRRDVNGDVAGYGIVNLTAHYLLRDSLSLETRLDNIFDKQYQIVDGFNTAGRSLFVTLQYHSTPSQ